MSIGFILSLVSALGAGGWIGSLITNWMTVEREKAQRKVQFQKQQLEEFYGPLLAMHKEIHARSELRVKLQQAIDGQYTRELWSAEPGMEDEARDAHLPMIMTNITDEMDTFRNVLMPRYRQMIDVFREKMWLAQPATREFFKELIEYVDVWDKILADKLPRSIASAVGHTEKNLYPFYRHLEETHDHFVRKLVKRWREIDVVLFADLKLLPRSRA